VKLRLLAVFAVMASVLTGIVCAGAAQADQSTTVSVPGAEPWTDTGISLSAGDSVSITASGTIYIAASDPGKTPAGDPSCVAADSSTETWVAPGQICWSMIGRIGNNPAFEVGTGTSFTAADGGELFLGVNDDYFPDNSGAWSATLDVTAPDVYAALGDSYSSGEGNGPYLTGSDTSTDQCHRSVEAYPELVASQLGFSSQDFDFVACSGAVIQDQFIADPNDEEASQTGILTPSTKLVTLTVGGNNADFGQVMTLCVFSAVCEVPGEPIIDHAIATMSDDSTSNPLSLAQLYMKIANLAPNATILVLGYPRFFPQTPPLLCPTGVPGLDFNVLQMLWINAKIKQMDNAIQTAVSQAAATGANVEFVNTYDAFNQHEICTSDPDMYAVTAVVNRSPVAGSFHPNQAGQAALAALVGQAYQ
jgi:GDSL-like Lipase/Acylhydrolase family